MQGGLATCKASLYSPKFLVLAISRRIASKTPRVRCGTWSHVRLSRAMGAVPSAEMMDVSVEKLFRPRHFCQVLARQTEQHPALPGTYIGNRDEVLDDNHALLDVHLGQNHLRNPVCHLVGV
jgi:hypothetical protein